MRTLAQPIADIHRAMLDTRPGGERAIAFTVEAPVREPLRLFSAATSVTSEVGRDAPALFWEEKDGPTWVGLKTAFAHRCPGSEGARSLLKPLRTVHLGTPMPWPARVFGGLAFETEVPKTSIWGPFGSGYFVVPRWSYVRHGERAWFMVVLDGREGPWARQADAARQEGELWYAALHTPWEASRPPALTVSRPGPQAWAQGVQTIRQRVLDGTVRKAVLTRDTHVESSSRIDPSSSLGRLAHEPTGSVRFAFAPEGRSGPTFVGLTPERLVRLQDNTLLTEALAGTAPKHAVEADAGALLSSAKDREEHDHVVRFIMDRLGPLCAHLEHASPQIQKLRHVMHLKTPITGRLAASMHVLDVVEALHPTPATGGVPLEAARALIQSLERRPRGWYTGPVGWFDGAGNGDFWVALRSALVAGHHARVFVGGGIVRDSDAEREWNETLLKERAVLAGLGVVV